MDKRIQTTFRIDPELLMKFKHALLENQKKMTPVIERLIRKWIQEKESKTQEEQQELTRPRPEEVITNGLRHPRATVYSSPTQGGEYEKQTLPERLVQDAAPSSKPQLAPSVLNPKYTFDNFVIGLGNQFAHAAARAVAERPSKAYNPLFIYGGVGLGKTHLLQAIGHEVKRLYSSTAIYLTAESFTNEMISALRYDRMSSFRDKFRNCDVLLVDDVQFLSQKERTQEEFFHTFNALHESGKQIIIAGDRPPGELPEIEHRLRSRFEWGLIADISALDFETKIAILMKKAEQERLVLSSDVAFYVASNSGSSVRELEGTLTRLVAYSSLVGQALDLRSAEQILHTVLRDERKRIPIESIQRMVAEQFGLKLAEIKARSNSRQIVYPRQIAMYLARHMTDASLPEIGRHFGGKHFTTVLHSVEKIEKLRNLDRDLVMFLDRITTRLAAQNED